VDKWSKALDKMTSLNILDCEGMRNGIYLKTSTVTVQVPHNKMQRSFWNDGTIPDSSMKEGDVHKLKKATHATADVTIKYMVMI